MIRTLSKHVVFRYIISGGTSAAVDLIVLFVLNSVLHMYYLLAAILAFLVAFCFSFTLHKFWTFQNFSREGMHKQVMLYMMTSLFGLGLNTLFMYIFVDYFHIVVLLSQVFVGAIVACCTFFLSRNFVFKYKRP